jgi:hypothetical protein
VDLHDTGRRIEDVERDSVGDQVGAEPDVLAAPVFQRRAEGVREAGRVGEFTPPAAMTRSYSTESATSGVAVRNLMFTPSSRQRFCRMFSRRLRLIAAKPWPPEVNVVPR